jgi:hypothetical protein
VPRVEPGVPHHVHGDDRPASVYFTAHEIQATALLNAISFLQRGLIGPEDLVQISTSSRPTPADEPCAQVGEELYAQKARAECRRFIKLLRETFGPEPAGAYLQARAFPHDYGTYYEVVRHFNPDVPHAIDYALRLEREAPTTWPDDPGYQGSTPLCPECGDELEMGSTMQLFDFTASDGYRCYSCKLLFARDLTSELLCVSLSRLWLQRKDLIEHLIPTQRHLWNALLVQVDCRFPMGGA